MAEQNAGEDPPLAKKAKTSNDQRKSINVIKDAITLIGSCWSQITEKTLANAWKNLLKKHKEVREIEILED